MGSMRPELQSKTSFTGLNRIIEEDKEANNGLS